MHCGSIDVAWREPGLPRGAVGSSFRSKDREDDHGEEVEGEEKVYQKEGGSGTQEKEDSEGGGEEDREESREKGGSQAQAGGEEASAGRARGRARSRSRMAALRFWFRRRRRLDDVSRTGGSTIRRAATSE